MSVQWACSPQLLPPLPPLHPSAGRDEGCRGVHHRLCAYLGTAKLDMSAESRTAAASLAAENCPSPANVFYLGLKWTALGSGHWLPFPAPLPVSGHWEFVHLSSVFLEV